MVVVENLKDSRLFESMRCNIKVICVDWSREYQQPKAMLQQVEHDLAALCTFPFPLVPSGAFGVPTSSSAAAAAAAAVGASTAAAAGRPPSALALTATTLKPLAPDVAASAGDGDVPVQVYEQFQQLSAMTPSLAQGAS